MAIVAYLLDQEHIAIDGKTARASYDTVAGKSAIHIISAWAVKNGIVLGQIITDDKSNEITAIPELIKQLELHGTIVSIDAMGCQKAIAKQIIDKQVADHLFSLKGNHCGLHVQISMFFQDSLADLTPFDRFESVDGMPKLSKNITAIGLSIRYMMYERRYCLDFKKNRQVAFTALTTDAKLWVAIKICFSLTDAKYFFTDSQTITDGHPRCKLSEP